MSKPTEMAGAPLVVVVIILLGAAACSTVYLAARADQPDGALDNQSAKRLVLVGFRGGPDLALLRERAELIQEFGGEMTDWWRIPAIACFLPGNAVAALKEDPEVAYVVEVDPETGELGEMHLAEPVTDTMMPLRVRFRDEVDKGLIRDLDGEISWVAIKISTIACFLPENAVAALKGDPRVARVDLGGNIDPWTPTESIPTGPNIIVGFRNEPDPVLIQELGGEVTNEAVDIPALACSLPENAVAALKGDPGVAYVEVDWDIQLVEPIIDTMLRVMVRFRIEPDSALIRELGGENIRDDLTIMPLIACSLPAEAIPVLQENPEVVRVSLSPTWGDAPLGALSG